MSKARFSDNFKQDAVHQITVRGYAVSEVSERLGVSAHSLYAWKKKFSSAAKDKVDTVDKEEIRRLKRELLRVTEERNILKRPRRTSRGMQSEVRICY